MTHLLDTDSRSLCTPDDGSAAWRLDTEDIRSDQAELRKQGQPLADFDLLIASTALSEGRVLVTNNIQHYARIPGLQLENWSTP